MTVREAADIDREGRARSWSSPARASPRRAASPHSGMPSPVCGSGSTRRRWPPRRRSRPIRTLVWGWYEWRRTVVGPGPPERRAHRDRRDRGGDPGHGGGHAERRRPARAGRVGGADPPARQPVRAALLVLRPAGDAAGRSRRRAGRTGRRLTPPACEHCGAPVRPGVVWFGEALPMEALEAAVAGGGRLRSADHRRHVRAGLSGRGDSPGRGADRGARHPGQPAADAAGRDRHGQPARPGRRGAAGAGSQPATDGCSVTDQLSSSFSASADGVPGSAL